MNWRSAKLLTAVLLLVGIGCGSRYDPFDPGGKEKDQRETREQELWLFYNLYEQYLECQKPGAINIGELSCISLTTTEAIFDHGTGLPLHAVTAAASAQLECRDPGRTGISAASLNAWYSTSVSMGGASLPFSGTAGQHLVCLVWHDRYVQYQALDIL